MEITWREAIFFLPLKNVSEGVKQSEAQKVALPNPSLTSVKTTRLNYSEPELLEAFFFVKKDLFDIIVWVKELKRERRKAQKEN